MAEGFSYSKNTAQERTYRAFEALITGNENSIDLAEAALLIASIEYPDLDRTFYLRQLDELARQVRAVLDLPYPETLPQLPEEIDPLRVLEAMNRVIFEKEQFHGNRQDYSSPDNSFFNKVLENRAGIPITLSLLYIEVGRRVGVTIEGIGLPWHFVVRYCLPQEIIYIDVFNQGHFMDERACRDMIRNMAQTRIRMHAEWFEPVKPRHFLFRILNNLKHIYVQNEDHQRALAICELMVTLMPNHGAERRNRGIIHLHLKHYARALHDFMAYIELSPDASDREEILEYIKTVRQTLSLLN
ncbi:MAG TPA: transglutaminase-like domain-containing protein [Ktedonobacteraceae bacterium]|jgi:regulator of sirC expression with transglutaminase-like and TPR domain|nr:transglutaminase-like domain-containing protein [Ktedonobacteraceae bacterium]